MQINWHIFGTRNIHFSVSIWQDIKVLDNFIDDDLICKKALKNFANVILRSMYVCSSSVYRMIYFVLLNFTHEELTLWLAVSRFPDNFTWKSNHLIIIVSWLNSQKNQWVMIIMITCLAWTQKIQLKLCWCLKYH